MPFGQIDSLFATKLFKNIRQGGVTCSRHILLLVLLLLQTFMHLAVEVIQTFRQILNQPTLTKTLLKNSLLCSLLSPLSCCSISKSYLRCLRQLVSAATRNCYLSVEEVVGRAPRLYTLSQYTKGLRRCCGRLPLAPSTCTSLPNLYSNGVVLTKVDALAYYLYLSVILLLGSF